MLNNQKQQKIAFPYVKLTTYYFKLDYQKVDQQTGGKWLIHGTNAYIVSRLNVIAGNNTTYRFHCIRCGTSFLPFCEKW